MLLDGGKQIEVSKIKGMLIEKVSFRHTFSVEKLKFKVSSNSLEVISIIKYLGVIIDNNLRFSDIEDFGQRLYKESR